MHITELTQELIAKLKEHVEVNPEGQILTKKSRLFYRQQPEDHAVKQFAGKIVRLGDTRSEYYIHFSRNQRKSNMQS
jgi:hypothetical protein